MRQASKKSSEACDTATGKLRAYPAADAPLIDWAKWQHDRGEADGSTWVTPLRPGEKAAYQTGWSKRPLKTREAVEAHWRENPNDNIGLVPRPGHFWLDADDLDVLEAMQAEHEPLPSTYTQRSINGSLHFLLKGDVTTSPAIKFNGQKLGEIRGAMSGQCVAAGSRGMTRDGEPGKWTVEKLAPPEPAPDWMLGLINSSGKSTGKAERRTDYGEPLEWDSRMARGLVAKVERGAAIKDYAGPFCEGERDNLTFQLFAEAKNRMIHPDVMLEAALEAGIDGGLGEDVVERKMQSAYHEGNTSGWYGEKVPRYWLPNHVFIPFVDGKPVHRPPADPVEWKAANVNKLPRRFPGDPDPEPATDAAGAPKKPEGLYDGPEYAERPQPQWIIRDVFQEAGYTIASGRSQAGKSFCELAKALSVATGKPWLGLSVKTTGPVLYIAAEGQGRIWQDVRAWCAAFDVDPESLRGRFFIYDRSARLNTKPGGKALTAILAHIERATGRPPILAVFDTLRRNMRGGVSQEEPTADVLHAVNELQAAGIGVTLVAHHGRGHDETKGLTEWEDDADAVAIYAGTVRDGTTTITFKKIKNALDGWSLAVEYATRRLPSGETTKVAVAGERSAPASRQAPSDRDDHASHYVTAMKLLDHLRDPSIGRKPLARAVMSKLDPDGPETNPTAFRKAVDTFAKRLGRLKPKHDLWRYVDTKNDNGEALTFRNPKHRGHRAAKPGRRRNAPDFGPVGKGTDDA